MKTKGWAIAALALALGASPARAQSNTLSGNIVSCGISLSSCSFSIPDADDTTFGYVSTTYTNVLFQLPDESQATYAAGAYVVQVQSVPNAQAYHVTGSFTATDSNTGKTVTGKTDYVVDVFCRSGRGGGCRYIPEPGGGIVLTIN